MNKFMGGLTLGIIATTCFFIFYDPLQKRPSNPQPSLLENTIDTLARQDTLQSKDANRSVSGVSMQNNANVDRDSLVSFAASLLGTPYLYGSADPAKGFDCSGFITYVFNHFQKSVPRSSYEFVNIGQKATLTTCRKGDVILFTGTDTLESNIGHIGIIYDVVNGTPSFIHSSSGKASGVTITSMDNKFYQKRFIAVIDLLSIK